MRTFDKYKKSVTIQQIMKLKPSIKQVTTKNFISWVKNLPDKKSFDYMDNENCVFASFVKSLGFKWVSCGSSNYSVNYKTWGEYGCEYKIPMTIYKIIGNTKIPESTYRNCRNNIITKEMLMESIRKIN